MKLSEKKLRKIIKEQIQNMSCTCPSCGHTWKKDEHKPCRGLECPKCGNIIGNKQKE